MVKKKSSELDLQFAGSGRGGGSHNKSMGQLNNPGTMWVGVDTAHRVALLRGPPRRGRRGRGHTYKLKENFRFSEREAQMVPGLTVLCVVGGIPHG